MERAVSAYTLRFFARRGCELSLINEMARYDRMLILAASGDTACLSDRLPSSEPRFRTVTLVGSSSPTMERWATFTVGAKLETVQTYRALAI